MGNLVESFLRRKRILWAGSHCAEKIVPLAREVTERFTTGKMECKKGKTHVLHKLNISEILHFTRRCYDDTCKNEM